MSDITASPLPGDFGSELSETEVEAGVTPFRYGRHEVIGTIFAAIGVLAVFALAPNLNTTPKTFLIDPPPDPVSWTFNPATVTRVIGVLWIVAGAAAFVRGTFATVRTALLASAALAAIPLILAVALALSSRPTTNVTNLAEVSLVAATPFALGSLTGLWCERSGIINIGIEGMMLASAGIGFMAYAVLGDAAETRWMIGGLVIAVLTGALMAALHAVLSIYFQINQIVGGVVINLVALGLTGFVRSQVIVPSGFPKGRRIADIGLPLLSDIPIVGPTIFTGGPIHFGMFALVVVSWIVLYKTAFGLRVRACGEHPHAAETVGVNVRALRFAAVVIGGMIAGLAGAWFSMESVSGFEDNMTNAAGFIALAALIVGKWKPWGAFGGALLFGFAKALGDRLQILDVKIGGFGLPSQLFQALPYLATIVIVAGALGRALAPAAEGRPYTPSK